MARDKRNIGAWQGVPDVRSKKNIGAWQGAVVQQAAIIIRRIFHIT